MTERPSQTEAHPETAPPAADDCSDVLEPRLLLPRQRARPGRLRSIQQHLDECGPCLARYDLERTVKTLVARSCTEVAPDGLRQRVMLSIRQVQVQITEES